MMGRMVTHTCELREFHLSPESAGTIRLSHEKSFGMKAGIRTWDSWSIVRLYSITQVCRRGRTAQRPAPLQFLGLRFSLFAAGLLQRRSLQARLRRSRVSDRVRNGTGIAAEVRANVFEQFLPIKDWE